MTQINSNIFFSELRIIFFAFLFFGHSLNGQDSQVLLDNLNQQISETKQQQQLLQNKLESLMLQSNKQQIMVAGLPAVNYLEHSAYIFEYSERHEQAKWVAHTISPQIVERKYSRSNDFRSDTLVATGTSTASDFFDISIDFKANPKAKGYGYDRGHLAPSADFSWSEKALSESYFYSNMSPMTKELNRDIWAKLESNLREYVIQTKHELIVFTGPVLSDSLSSIPQSPNQVSIPEQFYKVVYDPIRLTTIGFLLPNDNTFDQLHNYAVSVDQVESITNLNFFSNIDESLESSFDASLWLDQSLLANVDPIPFNQLNPGQLNTRSAKTRIKSKSNSTICGKVVATRKSKKGHNWLYFDLNYPNHHFAVIIKKDELTAFPFDPLVVYQSQDFCVTGYVFGLGGRPTVSVKQPNQLTQFQSSN